MATAVLAAAAGGAVLGAVLVLVIRRIRRWRVTVEVDTDPPRHPPDSSR